MKNSSIRKQIDSYVKEKYGITPEILPFSHEKYEIYRHRESGRWFSVFIEKQRREFGLDGKGEVEVICVKPRDFEYATFLMGEKGYLRGLPSKGWNWLSIVLDGTVSVKDICSFIDESYYGTKDKPKNKKTPLAKKIDFD